MIERTEEGFASRFENTATANDWLHGAPRWEGRVNTAVLLTISTEDAAARNRARRDALWLWPQPFSGSGFAWVRPPVLNPFTRIAVEMCAADGTLRAVGYEIEEAGALPRTVTQVRELTAPLRSLAVSR